MNSVNITGRLTKDPVVRWSGDMAIATFSVAINRMPGRNGEDRGADFPRVTMFGKQAENCERFLKKGSLIEVQGHIQTGSYNNKHGEKVYTTDVIGDRIGFLDGRNDRPKESTNAPDQQVPYEEMEPIPDEDIPF